MKKRKPKNPLGPPLFDVGLARVTAYPSFCRLWFRDGLYLETHTNWSHDFWQLDRLWPWPPADPAYKGKGKYVIWLGRRDELDALLNGGSRLELVTATGSRYKLRWRDEPRGPETRKCAICGNKFTFYKCGPAKYCGPDCARAAQQQRVVKYRSSAYGRTQLAENKLLRKAGRAQERLAAANRLLDELRSHNRALR